MSTPPDLTGKVFGRLTVMAQCLTCRRKSWECRCSCGKCCVVRDDCLKDGNTQSCGCLRSERVSAAVKTHGRYDTPEYVCWVNMLQRCTNTKHKHYPEYGGRGITVCDSWLKFENFYADMGDRPSAFHSIDRKDNNGNYCKENCRWANQKQQMNNTRSVKYITYGGETRTISEWAEHLYMQVETLRTRLKLGWSIQDALTTPVKPRNKRCLDYCTETAWNYFRIYPIPASTWFLQTFLMGPQRVNGTALSTLINCGNSTFVCVSPRLLLF